jgi:hypothetical protein
LIFHFAHSLAGTGSLITVKDLAFHKQKLYPGTTVREKWKKVERKYILQVLQNNEKPVMSFKGK